MRCNAINMACRAALGTLGVLLVGLQVPAQAAGAADAPEEQDATPRVLGRQIRREENKQSRVAILTVKTAKDLRRVGDEYRHNRLGRKDEIDELGAIAGELDELADPKASERIENMPWVVTRLSTSREIPRALAGRAMALAGEHLVSLRRSLSSATRGQVYIVNRLLKLARAARAAGGADAAAILGKVIEEQERIRDETEKLGERTMGKPSESLSPEERAEANDLAAQQKGLEQELQKATQEMADVARALAETDPVEAQAMQNALSDINRQDVGNKMQEAGKNIEENQTGAAQQKQQEILDALLGAQQELAQGAESPMSQLMENLAAMQNLAQQQEALLGEAQAMDQTSGPMEFNDLQGEQTNLQGELGQMMENMGMQPQAGQQEQQAQQGEPHQGEQGEPHQGEQGEPHQGENLAGAHEAMGEAAEELGQQNQPGTVGAMQEALDNLLAAQQQMASELAQMQAHAGQMAAAMQPGMMPGMHPPTQPGMMPGMPSQQAMPSPMTLKTQEYQPGVFDPEKGSRKDRPDQGWQASLEPREREILSNEANERFPARYERDIKLYYRNLATVQPEAGE